MPIDKLLQALKAVDECGYYEISSHELRCLQEDIIKALEKAQALEKNCWGVAEHLELLTGEITDKRLLDCTTALLTSLNKFRA